MLSGCKFCRLYVVQVVVIAFNQRPRCTQRDIKLVALQSSGVFDPRGSRQISMQAWLLGSLLAGIKKGSCPARFETNRAPGEAAFFIVRRTAFGVMAYVALRDGHTLRSGR